jgi:hypothetical protein
MESLVKNISDIVGRNKEVYEGNNAFHPQGWEKRPQVGYIQNAPLAVNTFRSPEIPVFVYLTSTDGGVVRLRTPITNVYTVTLTQVKINVDTDEDGDPDTSGIWFLVFPKTESGGLTTKWRNNLEHLGEDAIPIDPSNSKDYDGTRSILSDFNTPMQIRNNKDADSVFSSITIRLVDIDGSRVNFNYIALWMTVELVQWQ